VQRMTGVSPEMVRQVAEILARAQCPGILYGRGWIRDGGQQAGLNLPLARDARPCVPSEAVANLALLLGDIETGFVADDCNTLGALEMGVVPDLYPGRQPVQDGKIRNRLSSLWGEKLSPVEGLDFDGMIAAAREGSIKAMWVLGADPASDYRAAGAALAAIPFLVVQDLFMTDTALQAEVVLPAASFAEMDGSFVNLTGRLQASRAAMRPPGEARPDWWIIAELAKRLAVGKQRRAWSLSGPNDIWHEIARVSPGYRGVDLDTMGSEGWQRPNSSAPSRRAFVRVDSGPVNPGTGFLG
jgi:formate dehydrogenase major subunit